MPARSFSPPVGWWFGSKLQKEVGEPVGIINDSFGGTQIQDWLPLETLKKGPWPEDKSTDIEEREVLFILYESGQEMNLIQGDCCQRGK